VHAIKARRQEMEVSPPMRNSSFAEKQVKILKLVMPYKGNVASLNNLCVLRISVIYENNTKPGHG